MLEWSHATETNKLVDKMNKALALAKVVESEFKEIRRESLMLGVEWSSNVESLLAHLELDLHWLQKEFQRSRG